MLAAWIRHGWLAAGSVLALACGEPARRAQEELPVTDAGPSSDAGTSVLPDCEHALRNQDADDDGYTIAQGDCDDCDPERNPGLYDVPEDGSDQDCSGADEPAGTVCDGDLETDSEQAEDAARALGLCAFRRVGTHGWGVRSASWQRLGGREGLEHRLQVGLLDHFGAVTPREGARLLALSTGVARDAEDPDYTRGCDVFSSKDEVPWTNWVEPPDGYPQDSSQCEGGFSSEGTLAYNDVGLELVLRIPGNVRSLSFDSIFFTSEYPDFICSPFNDFFVVLAHSGREQETNVVFDANDDTVGVNTALLSVCREFDERQELPREIPCEQGPELLEGTGFDHDESDCGGKFAKEYGGASTGWLRTTLPVEPGSELTLRFRLWDSGDPLLDSTVLVDNFRLLVAPVEGPTTGPITSGS